MYKEINFKKWVETIADGGIPLPKEDPEKDPHAINAFPRYEIKSGEETPLNRGKRNAKNYKQYKTLRDRYTRLHASSDSSQK